MSFRYLTNVELSKARENYISVLIENGITYKTEVVPVIQASKRVTANAVYAKICAPHYHACAMDGIALEAKLTFGASETTPVTLTQEQYKYVDTGDPLPENCDCVVMIEDVIAAAHDSKATDIKLFEAATPWQHIRQIGEDICAGEMILPSYSKITPAAHGAMIAGGVTEVTVIKRPIVGFIPTGDEIVAPTDTPKKGEILEFNSVIFAAMLEEWGAIAKTYPIARDNAEHIKKAVESALTECDIVLLGAGSSAGRDDYCKEVITKVGTVLHHGIAIKPGKPAILGYSGTKPILGVPGYPVSGIIVLEQLLKPIIDLLTKSEIKADSHVEATLSKSVVSTLKYLEFVRVRLGYVNDKLIASPLGRGSGIVTSFMRADGILEVPQGVEGFDNGSVVKIRLLREKEQLKRSIVIIGSHDPLIDELADIMRIKHGSITISSAHVGSMGGLMAIKKGEAHIAGTHLLDEKTGEYNTSFVKKLLPDGFVTLIKCVKRKQGLMLQKGNPKKISGISDLKNEAIRYINRQKGSGTRILLDYLLKKEGIDPSKIHGYDKEEYTHTSVAALIASNSADAGLGIYSAAKMYDLDFLPICDEEYDLLIPDYALELPIIKEFLKILKSKEFKKRLDKLGGYEI